LCSGGEITHQKMKRSGRIWLNCLLALRVIYAALLGVTWAAWRITEWRETYRQFVSKEDIQSKPAKSTLVLVIKATVDECQFELVTRGITKPVAKP
jgi:hypothetical protein